MKRSHLEHLSKIWLTWIWAYFILGAYGLMNHKTSFIAAPLDLDLPMWFKLIFLNFPLQIALALSASAVLARKPHERPSTFIVAISFLATALMTANLFTAIWFLVSQ